MDMDPMIEAASVSSVSRKTLASDSEPMLYCPVCSLRLAERKCKLYCERCGYYMSCADYY
jgi:methionyl-tRNA synthetase